MLKERPSKVIVQLLEEDDCIAAEILEEVRSERASAAAALAKARADLIAKLVQDCEASDDDTLLKGWTGLPLSGTLKQNARLTTVMAMSDEWEGLEVRVGKVTPMVELAKELVDAYNAKKAKKSRRRMRSARRVPSSLIPEGCKRVRPHAVIYRIIRSAGRSCRGGRRARNRSTLSELDPWWM
ncbi:hypothetical protein HKX48_004388 [Thoreauomyces humboldtii]|nr:hypothetical protein HKX48_004388 [Thoreauomyces humboldtii]